uniref:transposase n=1 Tax=Streptococcus anginosus TaxID=1328 RepID=UPI0039E574AD
MEQLKNTTELIGLKDKNIKIKTVFKADTHITIEASLDYQPPLCPHCQGQMSKYDFQRASTIPILDVQGMPTVLKLKKRRFQCKGCRRVTVSETSLVKKHCQISKPVRQKITQYHTEKLTNTAIAKRLHLSVSLIQRQLEAFTFKEDFSRLPEVLSVDEFSRNKGQLVFIAQDFETRKIVTLLENNRQTTIKNYFYRYPRTVREAVKAVTVDMSGSYIPILRPFSPIFRLRLKQSLPYRAMKNHWKILQKDSRKLSDKRFYSRTFRQTLTPKEIVKKILDLSDELRYYYELYQLLLFHFQAKNTDHFMALIDDNLPFVNPVFTTVFKIFKKYKSYIANALELPYSNAKLEATNKLIKDIKRQAFGFRNFKNFKTKILIALNIKIERTNLILSRC